MTTKDSPRRAAEGRLRERDDSGAWKGEDAVFWVINFDEVVDCERREQKNQASVS